MEPFYYSNEDNVMIIVPYDNNLAQLHGLTVEVDNEFFYYLQGIDAWGELKEKNGDKMLVFKTIETTYFECSISDEILEKLMREHGFMLVETKIPITLEELHKVFDNSCEFEEIDAWMREKEDEHSLEIGDINGMLCCFFTEEEKLEHRIG